MARSDTIARLKAVPLFTNCSGRQLRRIADLGHEGTYAPGKTVVEEGKFADEFFVILDGHADVRKGGRKRGTLGPGDYFGEIALLQDVPRTATVRADTDARLYALERDDFLAVVTGNTLARTEADSTAAQRIEDNAAAAARLKRG